MNKLENAIKLFFEENPEDVGIQDWAGCNYHVNEGNNELEPLGTAQSIHDCCDCERTVYCLVKKNSPIWLYNADIEEEIERNWRTTLEREKSKTN